MARMNGEKRSKALELRCRGWSYAKIAKEIGTSTGRAQKSVTAELQRMLVSNADIGEVARTLELQRIDALLSAVWEKGQAGDLAAWDRCLAAILARARLMGMATANGKKGGPSGIIVQIIEQEATDARRTITVLPAASPSQTLPIGSHGYSPASEQDAAQGTPDALPGVQATHESVNIHGCEDGK